MNIGRLLASVGITVGIGLGLAAMPTVNAVAEEKKPNIVFIMSDDVGIWNIGAYSRGMMAGRTPNLDQTRQRRNAVHRLLCRGELHGGSRRVHHRRVADTHGPHHRRPSRRGRRAAGRGGDPCDGAQDHGLCHRPVRQEPSRRSQQVSADGPRLRRVFRLSVSPRRDGGSCAPRLSAGIVERRRSAQHGA